ncbi:MAG TPA: 16S rRNA (uracil(1498)-N(3))-methyltransferase [Methylomirabilota bacterium]|nr:16S rRNA (uracil(1498)-N(3))-methyltransferase [Methylomirabilota bacterium]
MDNARREAQVSGLRRFAIAPERIAGDRVVFDRAETRHMTAVLRLAPGDLVIAADGQGHDYTVRLESLGDAATGTILGVSDNRREPPLAITLVQSITKGDKMETIVRAVTELGVARVLPAISARTVVRLEPSRWRERSRRWQRIAREAAKQCGRAVVPEVETPRPLGDWLTATAGQGDLRLCFWEGQAPSLSQTLASLTSLPSTALIVVGPEGGLARDEVEAASAVGFRTASLGPRILRSETAGPAIAAILQFRFGDLGGPRL